MSSLKGHSAPLYFKFIKLLSWLLGLVEDYIICSRAECRPELVPLSQALSPFSYYLLQHNYILIFIFILHFFYFLPSFALLYLQPPLYSALYTYRFSGIICKSIKILSSRYPEHIILRNISLCMWCHRRCCSFIWRIQEGFLLPL